MSCERFLAALWSKRLLSGSPLLREAAGLGGRVATARIQAAGIEAALNSESGRSEVKVIHNFFRVERSARRVDELVHFGRLTAFLRKIGVADAARAPLLRSLAALRTSGEGVAAAFTLARDGRAVRKFSFYLWPAPGAELDAILSRLPRAKRAAARSLLDKGGVLGIDLDPARPAGDALKAYVGPEDALAAPRVDPRCARIWKGLEPLGFTQWKLKYVFPVGRGPVVLEPSYSVPLTARRRMDLGAIADAPELRRFRAFASDMAPLLEGSYVCSLGLKPGLKALQLYFVRPEWVDMAKIV